MELMSQKSQDRWIIEEVFPGLRGGYFLDLAASDGVSINNTIVLERELGWQGLAIEPNPGLCERLRFSRTCSVSSRCVDGERREVSFFLNGDLGGIVDDDTDNSQRIRGPTLRERPHDIVNMPAVTLADVLAEHGAPRTIHYFSFDVEGAEARILRTFPFQRYRFLALTIERPPPELNKLLFANGYQFVRNMSFDSFYVHESITHVKKEAFEQVPPKDW
jgi:methyltransferase FkbM-like protein